MSIRSACYVACDGPCGGDPATIVTDGAKAAREVARGEGYVRRRVDGRLVDLCPGCADLDGDTAAALLVARRTMGL